MDLIEHIFETLGGPTAIANHTSVPVQTVWQWKAKGNIPRWRRTEVLNTPPVEDKALSAAAVKYLKSPARNPLSTDRSAEIAA